MRLHRTFFILLLVLFPACVARDSTGKINFSASTTQTILTLESSWEAIMKSMGDARRAREISAPVLERGRVLGQKVEVAIITLKDVTAAYLRGGGAQSPVFAAMSSLTALMIDLERFYLDVTGNSAVPVAGTGTEVTQ